MAKKTIYYETQRYKNTPSGNPNKAIFTYSQGDKGNLYIDKVKTYSYQGETEVLNDMYKDEKVEYKRINNPIERDKFADVKKAEKQFM